MTDPMPQPAGLAARPSTRQGFASLAHATAHEVLTLRELLQRARREGATTLEAIEQLVLTMVAERGRFLAMNGPDVASDLLEAANEERRRA